MSGNGNGDYTSTMEIRTRRIDDPATAEDGPRILADGLWPRGIRREQANLDGWWRELAPSGDLRRWFAHNPGRWEGSKQGYFVELDTKHAAVSAALAAVSGDRP
jgi:uncharacterized protein YeaO (DUF488 family)